MAGLQQIMRHQRAVPLTRMLAVVLAAACGSAAPPAPAPALDLGELLGGADTLHARAVDVPAFAFPADHGPHPEFRTEWWYWTGNLIADDGREFGYQLTFFRSALTDSATYAASAADAAEAGGDASAWRSRHAWMAHFAVSDIGARSFHHAERFARDAVGLAGAQADPFRVWLGPWQATGRDAASADAGADGVGDAGKFPVRLVAADGDVAVDLMLEYGKPLVLQGDRGLSRKGPEPGNASYYYSFTRMPTRGTIRIGDRSYGVTGLSWLDREWSTSALSADLAGWDWMSLQLDDGTELMLYRLRRHDGTAGEFSAGSFVGADGASVTLAASDFTMTPTDTWRSPRDGTAYPVTWQVSIARVSAELTVSAAYGAQEMDTAVRYWEGAVHITGTRAGAPVMGRGYLEMTGY